MVRLLLETPHTLATGHGEVKLILTRKHPLYWLSVTVPEGERQAAEGAGVAISSPTQL